MSRSDQLQARAFWNTKNVVRIEFVVWCVHQLSFRPSLVCPLTASLPLTRELLLVFVLLLPQAGHSFVPYRLTARRFRDSALVTLLFFARALSCPLLFLALGGGASYRLGRFMPALLAQVT